MYMDVCVPVMYFPYEKCVPENLDPWDWIGGLPSEQWGDYNNSNHVYIVYRLPYPYNPKSYLDLNQTGNTFFARQQSISSEIRKWTLFYLRTKQHHARQATGT